MRLIDKQGWLQGAACCPSPNFDGRPDPADISLLVIHNISLPAGEFGTGHVHALFCNRLDCSVHPSYSDLENLRVSSHLLIDREGGIHQFVSFLQRAWHAGVSSFHGRERCNDFSIGIELEGTDHIPYTRQQYAVLVEVTKSLQSQYSAISLDRIVGHCDIAPGRKTDPGPSFDWAHYKQQLG